MILSSGGRLAVVPAVAASCIALAACSLVDSGSNAASTGAGTAKKTGELTIAYLQKQGDQQYFVDEATGAKQEAAKRGDVNIRVVDLGTDSNKAISSLNAMIAQQVDGIVIIVPDQKIGPQVIQAAQEAGIPLIASADPIESGDGKPAPFVGFDSLHMGTQVGRKAGELFSAAGWSASNTKIMTAYSQGLTSCQDREKGAEQGFESTADTTLPIVKLGTDNSNVDAQNKAAAAITANPGVKHWVAWGCNDESETGVVTALQNAGVSPANIIGVGLGGYLTCKDWKAGAGSGNKAALYISGNAVGHTTVKIMVDHLRNGSDLPATTQVPTKIVDPHTWKTEMGTCE